MTTSPVAENANKPSLIAPATFARATVASTGRSARCLLRLGDVHNSYFLLHGGPVPIGLLGRARSLPVGRSQAGDHRFTLTSLGTTSGHGLRVLITRQVSRRAFSIGDGFAWQRRDSAPSKSTFVLLNQGASTATGVSEPVMVPSPSWPAPL
jgi:hypothetical protein